MFRVEEELADWLGAQAKANSRSVAQEVRAAAEIYRDLVELAHVRAVRAETPQSRTQLEDLDRRLRDNIGRVLLAAITGAARSQFENDAGVEYPTGRFAHIPQPFEKLLPWIATGEAE